MVRKLTPVNCAINTASFGFQAPITEVIEEVARHGFGALAPWRREMEGQDIKAIAKKINDAGLKVTGYCRSTYMPAENRSEFEAALQDNIKALHEASILGADSFALVVGTLRNLTQARAQVAESLALLLPHAKNLGVKLALEPLHPIYAADRACVNTIAQGLEICDAVEGQSDAPSLGLLVDAYHNWWDPNLAQSIAAAGKANRIFGFHVSDFLMPVRDVLNDRGMMGDGVIDLPYIRGLVEGAGYNGSIEVEIFSTENWWKRPMCETCDVIKKRLASVV